MIRYLKLGWLIFFLYTSIWGAPYTDNGNGTVTDTATGLIWQKCSAGQGTSIGNCSTGSISKYTWLDAISYCEGLILGNRSNWRLPNINELGSLIDYSRTSSPAFDSTSFPNFQFSGQQVSIYWSSSTYLQNTSNAWIIDFNSGWVDGINFIKGSGQYVRCVSGP